ncbi:MAG: adenine phosphoribosyltransferase [Deltaproteobacteria bacterium]|nr:adenine phosphoribosyltransferase [Deltaproteobacteria bacterium]
MKRIRELIRDIPDFPKPGIVFKDITPLLSDADAFRSSIALLSEEFGDKAIDTVVGIESRGFIFGAALALNMHKPFVPVRKPGKLPSATYRIDYDLEYGSDALEIHKDAFLKGARVLLVDDLLATGGTARATAELISKAGGTVAAIAFLVELTFLDGAKNLKYFKPYSLIKF